jgi:glucokinase
MKIAANIGRATRRRSMPSVSRAVVVANPLGRHHARVTSTDEPTGTPQLAIGLDIGGTKIAAGLVDRSGKVHAELQEPTPPQSGAVVIAAILLDLVAHLREGRDVAAVGVGAAGIVRWPEGRMLWAPNNAYRDWAIRDELERETGLPAVVDNDANVAGFAEARLGERAYRQMLFVTVGTGIGGGLVLDGEIYRGPTGMGAELGHMNVDPLGPRCGCGLHGCLEAVASGSALSRMGREAAATNPDGLIARLGRADGAVTGHTVTAAAKQDDPTAREIFTRLGRWLGIGIASLSTIFELEAVVIGGGVVHTGDLLLSPVRAALREYAYAADARGVPPVLPATFGNAAGIIGAALLALEHADRKPAVSAR